MKIVFLTLGDENVASSRTRVFQYLPHLSLQGVQFELLKYRTGLEYWLSARSNGVWVSVALKFVALWDCFYSAVQTLRFLWKSRAADIVFIQKVLLPIFVQHLLRRLNARIVFDYDDALYADEKSYLPDRLQAQMKSCRLAVIENESTEAYARSHGVPVVRITGPIDCARYRPGRPLSSNSFTVGWIGSRSTTAYLEELKRPLKRLADKYPDVVLMLIGAGPFDLPGVRVERFPWHLDTEVSLLERFDVGLMPLPDTPFTQGKGGYKLMQYMAMGLPALASPVGVNREIMQADQTGFFCKSEEEWFTALERLRQEKELRMRLGKAARQRVMDHYSFEVSTTRLLEALRKVQSSS